MRFETFVFKNIARRPMRSALTALGMAIAVGAVVSLVGISRGFEGSFRSIYEHRHISLIVQQASASQRLTSAVDERLGEMIAAVPGVKRVNSGLVDMISLPGAGAMGALVQGWPADSANFDEIRIIQGDRLRRGDHGKILLGKILAANLQKKVGDRLEIFEGEPFQVKGVFETPSVFENGSILMLLEDLQKFMGREGQVSGFTVVLQRGDDRQEVQRVARAIEALDKGLAATPYEEFVGSTNELQLVKGMAWLTSAVALLLGGVMVLITMITSVFERTREIGILRAIGWAKGRIARMILLESVLLSLAGALAGSVLAIALTRVLTRFPAVNGMIDDRIPPSVVLEGFAVAVLIGLLGAAYPTYRAAQLLPTEAIRHE